MNPIQHPFSYFHYEDFWGLKKKPIVLQRPPGFFLQIQIPNNFIFLPNTLSPYTHSPYNSPNTLSPYNSPINSSYSSPLNSPRSDLKPDAYPYSPQNTIETLYEALPEDEDLIEIVIEEPPQKDKSKKKIKVYRRK